MNETFFFIQYLMLSANVKIIPVETNSPAGFLYFFMNSGYFNALQTSGILQSFHSINLSNFSFS
jgi:hypothetical protein